MKSPDRIRAEREMAIGLPRLAKKDPAAFGRLMKLLARLVVESRKEKAVQS